MVLTKKTKGKSNLLEKSITRRAKINQLSNIQLQDYYKISHFAENIAMKNYKMGMLSYTQSKKKCHKICRCIYN